MPEDEGWKNAAVSVHVFVGPNTHSVRLFVCAKLITSLPTHTHLHFIRILDRFILNYYFTLLFRSLALFFQNFKARGVARECETTESMNK